MANDIYTHTYNWYGIHKCETYLICMNLTLNENIYTNNASPKLHLYFIDLNTTVIQNGLFIGKI
jgi:hypothetical protein